MLRFFAELEPCLVGMEAGSAAHYWARELRQLGHDARIIDPRLVAPYRSQGRMLSDWEQFVAVGLPGGRSRDARTH